MWRESPAHVAANSDITFAIVGFPSDVREVFLGPDGTLAGAEAGDLLVDMTSSEPRLAVDITEKAREEGVGTIDAPVSGGDVDGRNGTQALPLALARLSEVEWEGATQLD